MTKNILMSTIVISAVMLSGCSTVSSVASYKASTKNVIAIKDSIGSSDKKVKVVDFTSAKDIDGTWCRAIGPVQLGSAKTLAQFVGEAFQEELFNAGVYSSGAPVTLTGYIDSAKFSSMSPASWDIALTISSSTGKSYQITTHYAFDTSWDAISACKNVTDAFPGAVQETLHQVVIDPRFKDLF